MFNREGNKKFCGEILREIAERHKIMITEVSVRSNHIHTVVEIPPTMSVLKGTSSRELVNKKSNFRVGYPKDRLWSPGKLYRSVRDTDAETAIQYVRNQRFQQTSLDDFPSLLMPSIGNSAIYGLENVTIKMKKRILLTRIFYRSIYVCVLR